MALETLSLKAKGLSRYSDPLSSRPQGSLNEATNIVIDQENLFSPRRGFEKLGVAAAALPSQAKNIIPFKDELLVYAESSTPGSNSIYRFNETTKTFTEYSGFSSDANYVKWAESKGNLYVTGDTGVYKLEKLDGSFIEAGIPEALGGYASTPSPQGTGWMDASSVVAYRVVWGLRDENDNVILGPPCAPIYYYSPGAGTVDPKVSFYIPDEITARYFYQIYRTTSTTGTEPGREFFLVYEKPYDAGDVSGGVITVQDTTPDELAGVSVGLYTNDTREGIQAASYQPPKSGDIAVFNDHAFYAALAYRHTFSFQLLATGTDANKNNLIVSDTLVIAGQTYTASAAENVGAKQFLLQTAPGGDPAVDIRVTAESLVKCINGNASNTTVYAYYDSDFGQTPGLIRIEERDFGGSAFTVQCANSGTAFSPNISTAQTSTAEQLGNLIAWSKFSEPEAVPLSNILPVGSKDKPILRLIALRDSLFIFKGDGIWRLTGTTSANFSIDAFDSSFKVLAANTLCVLNNLVFGLFDQGICQVSESGVSILSIDIEGDIRGYIGSHYSTLSSLSFAFAYETDRKYIMAVPTDPLDTYPSLIYVYNTITNTWTTWDRSMWAGIVNPANDRIYAAMADIGVALLSKERKDATYTDFADEQIEVRVSSVNALELTLVDSTGIEVGDMYVESDTKFSKVTAVNSNTHVITVEDNLDWSPEVVTVTVTNVNDKVITISSTQKIEVGDIYQDDDVTSEIVGVDDENLTITLDDSGATGANAFVTTQWEPQVKAKYLCTIEWNPIHLNSPGHMKQWFEVMTISTKDFDSATLSVKSEGDAGYEPIELTGSSFDAWGLFPWGEVPWGGASGIMFPHRTYIPRKKQRAGTIHFKLEVPSVYSDWTLSGVEVTYRDAGSRLLRR